MRWFLFKVRKSQFEVILIEEYLIVTCDFIGKRLVSPASCIFMKMIFCQSSCPRYVWSVMEESTVVADDSFSHRSTNIKDFSGDFYLKDNPQKQLLKIKVI